MKPLVIWVLFGGLLGGAGSGAAQPAVPLDDGAIRSIIAAFPDAWNRHDMKAVAGLFTEEAAFVVITGKVLSGRGEIETYHADLQKTAYKDSHLAWNPLRIRFLRSDVAIAQVATEITYGPEKRTSVLTLVVSKRGDGWLIEALQNTLTSGPQVASPTPSAPR